MKYSVGLDLGGTKLAAALVDEKGQILSFRKESILILKKGRKGPEQIIRLMTQIISGFLKTHPQCFKKNNFRGIGLASAGPLNVEDGELINPVNFQDWKIVPIVSLLRKSLKAHNLPFEKLYFQNDAMAAALAEQWMGSAKNLSTFAMVTMGTGIGTGVIFKNQPLHFAGMGSEFGHLIVDIKTLGSIAERSHCTVEGLASGTGLLRQARLLGFTGANIEELVTEIESESEKGHEKYRLLFDQAALALAVLCYNLSIGFHPQKILLSGGLIKIRHLFWKNLKLNYENLIKDFNPAFKAPLQIAKSLNQAGVLGAAYLPLINAKKR